MPDNSKRVLITGSRHAVVGAVRFNLEMIRLRVWTAASEAEAWQLLRRQAFDLIVIDHQLAEVDGLNGVKLCRALRKQRNYANAPIILFTTAECDGEADKLPELLGKVVTLPKPFSPAQLIQTVTSQVEKLQ